MKIIQQFLIVTLLICFVAGLSFGQSVSKGMLLPSPAGEYQEEPDTKCH